MNAWLIYFYQWWCRQTRLHQVETNTKACCQSLLRVQRIFSSKKREHVHSADAAFPIVWISPIWFDTPINIPHNTFTIIDTLQCVRCRSGIRIVITIMFRSKNITQICNTICLILLEKAIFGNYQAYSSLYIVEKTTIWYIVVCWWLQVWEILLDSLINCLWI